MTPSATTAPTGMAVDPSQLSDHDLYESFRDRGLSHAAAVLHVERRRRATNQPVENVPTIPNTSPEKAALYGVARTATSGFADELAGALAGLRGPDAPYFSAKGGFNTGQPVGPLFNTQSYEQMRDQVRNTQNQALVDQPGVSLGAGFLGAQINPLNYVLGPLTKFMTPGQTGATYGAAFGGAQGAGEGESKLGRLTGAGGGLVGGAILGGTLGWVGGGANKYSKNLWKAVRPTVQKTAANIAASVPKDLPEEVINGLTETSVRAQLAKQGFQPPQIDDAITLWKNQGNPPPPAPPEPVAVRPGETVTPTVSQKPILPDLRANADPLETTPAYIRGGNPRGLPDLGKGQTLPYYPRGGRVEQGMAPFPAQAPTVAPPNQSAVLIDYLKQATSPQDAIARLGTLHNLGIPVPQDPTQILQLLFGAH